MDMSLARAQQTAPPEESFADSLFAGLGKAPKEISCKYFYDQEGSQLFERICTLPEYYQTRTETLLLASHAQEIAQLMGGDIEIVEFGAGASQKVRILLDTGHVQAYSPLDISGDYLREVVIALAADYPTLTMRPLIGDFTRPLEIPALPGTQRRAGFFPGSTIGNMQPEVARHFLTRVARLCGHSGGLIIGVDLQKSRNVLEAAYNDSAGVTALFNLNMLVRANRELGADFDLPQWRHRAIYNQDAHRIEMHLISERPQTVHLGQDEFHFEPGEKIITEFSYKHTIEGFSALAASAGFQFSRVWTDPRKFFAVFHFTTL